MSGGKKRSPLSSTFMSSKVLHFERWAFIWPIQCPKHVPMYFMVLGSFGRKVEYFSKKSSIEAHAGTCGLMTKHGPSKKLCALASAHMSRHGDFQGVVCVDPSDGVQT